MAKLPGLESQQVNSPDAKQKQGRGQVQRQHTRRVSLNPQATVGNYQKAPGRVPQPTAAMQLANALGSLAPTLGKLSTYMSEKQRTQAEQQAQAEMAQLSMSEAQEMVESGRMSEYDNPYFQEAFSRQYGMRLGLHQGRDLKNRYASDFDPRTDDIDAFIDETVGARTEQLAGNPLIQKGYLDALQDDMTSLRDAASQQRASLIEQDKLDGAFEILDSEFTRRIEKASTPEGRGKAIDEAYQAARLHVKENKDLLGLSYAEQDVLWLQLAAKHARAGNPDVVEKIVSDERGGVGSLINKRGKMGAEASSILATAESNFADDQKTRYEDTRFRLWDEADRGELSEDEVLQLRRETPGAITEAQATSLLGKNRSAIEAKHKALEKAREKARLQQEADSSEAVVLDKWLELASTGDLDTLEPAEVLTPTGKTKTLSVDQQNEQFLNTYLKEGGLSDRIAAARGESADARFNRELNLLSFNGLVHPVWKQSLDNGPSTAHLGVTMDPKAEIPPALQRGYTLYRQLHAQNPQYLNTLVSDSRDREFYEAMRVAQQYGGFDEKQAAQAAYRMNQEDFIKDNPSIRPMYDEIDAAVADTDLMKGFWNDTEAGDVGNQGMVSAEIRRAAQFYAVYGGLNVSSALKEAKKSVGSRFTVINDWAIPAPGRGVPENFPDLAENHINSYFTDNREALNAYGITAANELSVTPTGSAAGSWIVIDNSNGMPISGSEFTTGQVKKAAAEAAAAAQDAAASEVVANQQRGEPGVSGSGFLGADLQGLKGTEQESRVLGALQEAFNPENLRRGQQGPSSPTAAAKTSQVLKEAFSTENLRKGQQGGTEAKGKVTPGLITKLAEAFNPENLRRGQQGEPEPEPEELLAPAVVKELKTIFSPENLRKGQQGKPQVAQSDTPSFKDILHALKGAFSSMNLRRGQQQPVTPEGGLSADELAIEAPAGSESYPAAQFPADMINQAPPEIQEALQQFKAAGINSRDLDTFIQRMTGADVQWPGTNNDGNAMKTTFGMNRSLLEQLRTYMSK